MAYCTVDQVKAEFKELAVTSTSALKTEQIEEFIAEADALINAIISTRYIVPIASGDALMICRMLSRTLVADRVAGVLRIKSGQDKNDQDATKMSRADVMKMLKEIASGKIDFTGGTLIQGASGVSSYTGSNCVERKFKRGEKQW